MNPARKLSATAGVILAVLLASTLLVLDAAADTIYLKNGRQLRTREARVEGDRVVFWQYGARQAIPLELVERIEDDEITGPEPRATVPAGEVPAAAAGAGQEAPSEGEIPGQEEPSGEAAGQEAGPAPEEEEEEQIPPEQTREYWQQRLRPVFSEMSRIESELRRLRPHAAGSANIQRQVEELERRLRELERQAVRIRDEARRQGVPPGWLRRPGD